MLAEGLLAILRPAVVAAGGVLDYPAAQAAVLTELRGSQITEHLLRTLLDEALIQRQGEAVTRLCGQVLDIEKVAERLVLTHRIGASEHRDHRLDVSLDLAAFGRLAELHGGLHLPDGTPLALRRTRARGAGRGDGVLLTAHLKGPEGWLDSYPADELLAARVASGFLDLRPVAETDIEATPAELDAALDKMMSALNDGNHKDYPITGEDLQFVAAIEHPEWFSVCRPPFSELVRKAGLEDDGNLVGRPGLWHEYNRLAELFVALDRHPLAEQATPALFAGLKAFAAWRDEPTGQLSDSTVAAKLHHHFEAAYALDEEFRHRDASVEEVAGFAQALATQARGEARALPLWLEARAAARHGQTLEAEQLVEQALEVDGSFVPAIDESSWYLRDRGQVREALNLLRPISDPDDLTLTILQRRADLLDPSTGRNEPCPCGSGRKFKQCHLGRIELPEAEQVLWILEKAFTYLDETAPLAILDQALHSNCGETEDEEEAHLLGLSALLFDHGWMERFLAARGPLLSDRETAIIEAWITGWVTSVFRVDATEIEAWQLTDAAGVTRSVEPTDSLKSARLDQLLFCWLLPVGTRWYTSGVTCLVPLSDRSHVLELADLKPPPAPEALVAGLLGLDEPEMTLDSRGQPIVHCVTEFAVELDPSEVASRLDATLQPGPLVGNDSTWELKHDKDQSESESHGTVRLVDGNLVARADSIPSHEELLGVLAATFGEMEVVSTTREPGNRLTWLLAENLLADEARRALLADDDDTDDVGVEADPSPQLLAAMAQIDEQFKDSAERWLDKPVPELRGCTPREAARDESLRPDLRTLLAELEARRAPHTAFFRTELGLSRN